jgi:hypothetical protein
MKSKLAVRSALLRVILAVISVVLAFVVGALTGINKFTHAWIQDPWFVGYEVAFFSLLALELGVLAGLINRLFEKWWLPVVTGAVAGWASGSIAIVASVLMHGGMTRIQHLGRIRYGWASLLFVPIPLMSWFIGGLAGASMTIVTRRVQSTLAPKSELYR